jgi:hypothetical protein
VYLDVVDLLFDGGGEPQFCVGLACEGHHEVVEVGAGSHCNKIIYQLQAIGDAESG